MSVTYLNRLVVSGSPARVAAFRDTMKRTLNRKAGPQRWRERVPFSLKTAARLTGIADPEEYEYEPYQMSAWPMRLIAQRHAEVRYQFETRNVEISDLVALLSKRFPNVTLVLGIHCLDDDSPYSFHMQAGRVRRKTLSDAVRETYWQAARKHFKLPADDDEFYHDDDVVEMAEGRMFDSVMNHWEKTSPGPQRSWWNQPAIRSLDDERTFAMVELAEALMKNKATKKQPAKKKRTPRRPSK